MENKYIVILAIISIISLIFLYRKHTYENIIAKEPYHRENPVPIFNPVMNLGEKYYESIPNMNNSCKKIIVVMCYADWCGHCHRMLPIFLQLKDTNTMKNVTYLTVEEKDSTANSKYHNNIKFYPTILIDVDGVIKQYDGSVTKTEITKYINNL